MMEAEIAGKMLSCLRQSSPEIDDSKLNVVDKSCSKIDQNDDDTFSEQVQSSLVGYSFSQFIAQSVDGLSGINVDDYEEVNYNILSQRQPLEDDRLWMKFRSFWEEYCPSDVNTNEILTDLKSEISSITGVKDEIQIERASLIVINLYFKEKSVTSRKEELQRIFNISDFTNVHKISNVVNEVFKVLSSKQLEDFTLRWDEIFKDRIDGLEKYFHSKQINKTTRTNKCKNDRHLPRHDWKKALSRRSRKMHLLEQIRTICLLTNNSLAFDARIEEETADQQCSIINVELKLSARNADGESPQYSNVNFKCEVSPRFLFREFTREEAIKLLMENIRKLFKQKSLKCKTKTSLAKKMLNESKTISCYDQFFDLQIDESGKKHKTNVYGKKWIEKQLKNTLHRDIFESINCKLIVLAILDYLSSQKSNEELEAELIDIFGVENICVIRTIVQQRENIARHNKFTSQKNGVQNLMRLEVDKLKKLIDSWSRSQNEFDAATSSVASCVKTNIAEYYKSSNLDRNVKPKKECLHVYDANLEKKLSSSFVCGSKIMLPECHTRKDTRTYEEILIPISIEQAVNFDNEPVYISSMDNIGKTVFSGIEKLNVIQSIVFNTAYYSNENILVCAPTGAGKTNVALLTIVREIKRNTENDVIKKEKFKIIYIAPMKALAAEMTANFSSRLQKLGIVVKELTGDMQLSKAEIAKTQILVTTPEKWDLVTRKGDGDTWSSLVKLLIIDEVHLLHSDRGPVIEALVARTLRQVESSQKMIRIVGLSATLPNYKDVATFLRVNLHTGLFYFDSRYRPVPLSQCFVGVKGRNPPQQMAEMNQVCYDKVLEHVKNGMQVMVFVHARNATMKTAMVLRDMAQTKGHLAFFQPNEEREIAAKKLFDRPKARQLCDLLPDGFGIHHAGLLRYDRTLVEDCFRKGFIKVLVCTSTLAWGVNLPAHAVVIKGTEIYDSKRGSFVDLGILDVLQIFGRAGRPQFNDSGYGVIITSHNKLHHYLSLMTNQFPIESRFISFLADNLNAEITLGTITDIKEAVEWLSYTYLFVRMKINPQEYGINYGDVEKDESLHDKRQELIESAAKTLDKLQMIRYNDAIEKLSPTDLGRTASLFYVSYITVEIFNGLLNDTMSEGETLNMLSQAQEFEQLKVRDDEMDELDELSHENCDFAPAGGSENIHGKVNILLQTYLSRGRVKSFSLISDLAYISQNAGRIMRALFDIVLKKNNPLLAGRFLMISQMLERQQWYFETPLRQFKMIPADLIAKIENKDIQIDDFREMDYKEIGVLLRNAKMGSYIKKCVEEFPNLLLSVNVQPITRAVLRVRLMVKANFEWNDAIHGRTSEPFWIWVEDPDTNFMYHSEYFSLTRMQAIKKKVQELAFTIPLHEPLPSQYVIRVSSDRWLGCVSTAAISLHDIVLPELHAIQTELLPLQPLPVTALQCAEYESLFKFTHFNPIQTQIFHCLYCTDNNVLVGAPTGSGKTIIAEIAFLRVFKEYSDAKVVYIAPLKALVKERMRDWKVRFQKKLKKEVVELTGDVTPDIGAISSASIIVTTPEKWDSISRSWQTRNYVQKVKLIVIDEIHLLGEDRGPVLEVIVSRTNFIVSHTERSIRIVGLSTALANAQDLANWLRINETGMYNFRPSVRPVPLEVHIRAFPGKYYCPRMASMNKPAYNEIKQYSPTQPVLVFVSSRRQTRLTAMDLLAHLAFEDNPKQWLKLKEAKLNKILDTIKDDNLKVVLSFGIGLHHAGLQESDRKTVEELFEHQQIQVLIATSTLAWGVNFPAHLVVIKGTEYYDCKTHRYVDMPITDILQMMGRAGRPQFDKQGVAVVMVHDVKKNFYKKFLYEPFPVESNLLAVLPDHLNAELVAGTVRTTQDAVDYLTWTYFFRRLLQNPTYYGIQSIKDEDVNKYLTQIITAAVMTLEKSQCLVIDEDGRTLHPTSMGRIASYYYISHETMLHFKNTLRHNSSMEDLLDALTHAHEYSEIPVRHNEEILNSELAKLCKIQVDSTTFDSPFTKTHLLLQAHFSRLVLPCTDYYTDLKTVLDQAVRIVQAMIDVCGEHGWLAPTLRTQQLMQMLVQARWISDHPITTLPGMDLRLMYLFTKNSQRPPSLPLLFHTIGQRRNYGELLNLLQEEFTEADINKIYEVISDLPKVHVGLSMSESIAEDKFVENAAVKTIMIDLRETVTVKVNSEYVLQMKLTQTNRQRKDATVYAPKFPKPKDESWFLNLGDKRYGELLALKRFTFGRRKEVYHNFVYCTPNVIGPAVVTIYLMSDSYLGLDQQFDIRLNVIP